MVQKMPFPAYGVSVLLQEWGQFFILQNLFANQESEFCGTATGRKLYVIMPSSFLVTSSSAVVELTILL